MLSNYTSADAMRHIREAIWELPQCADMALYVNPQFVCYGSFATNSFKDGSDVDMMMIHENPELPPTRIQARHENYPVTMYALSVDDFVSDGKIAKYGGFFTGKLINPHVWVDASDAIQATAGEAVARFIQPYANYVHEQQKKEILSADDIASHVISGYLHMCPWYKYYFLKIYTHHDFLQIWSAMSQKYEEDFIKAGLLAGDADIKYFYDTEFKVHEETIIRAARFWSIGAIFHNQDPNFIDFYVAKVVEATRKISVSDKFDEMFEFLQDPTSRFGVGARERLLRGVISNRPELQND